MTSKDILNALEKHYDNAAYTVSNIYFFGHPYSETDFLVVQKSGYIYDIEVKVSRSDFKADFKKVDKHSILRLGGYTKPHRVGYKHEGKIKLARIGEIIPFHPPNRFYYAVPEGLITKKEVPPYAGLLYIKPDGKVVKIKEAPLLTKVKTPYEKVFANKFYYAYKELKRFKEENGIGKLNSYIKALENKLNNR